MGYPAFGRRVERPADTASRDGDVTHANSINKSTVDNDNDTYDFYTNSSGSRQFLENIGFYFKNGTHTNDVALRFHVWDGNSVVYSVYAQAPHTFNFDPSLPLDDGHSVRLYVENDSGATVEYDMSCLIRE